MTWAQLSPRRHCERSDAIQSVSAEAVWIASAQGRLARRARRESRLRRAAISAASYGLGRCGRQLIRKHRRRDEAAELAFDQLGHFERRAIFEERPDDLHPDWKPVCKAERDRRRG